MFLMANKGVEVNPYLFFYLFRNRNAFTKAARLVTIAATPIKNEPSILTMCRILSYETCSLFVLK
ncbi:hypothetical protein SFOMI_3023 [Sphingobium fuliginis]|uniref:Uncharacterized protein n=1 Tax=Sphingobium fuliginis (strain ATCC 27551) TaxID=336203 RepID=A0A292ZHQ9_SPHSA|nr:hypothetical protein SFOMI_3023 [Sphingobium fuliginis]